MKIALPDAGKVPLNPGELCDVAVRAQLALEAMQDAHAEFDKRVSQIRSEVANRYNGSAFRGMTEAARRKVAETESASRVIDVRSTATATMNAIAKDQIAPILAKLNASKGFYKSAAYTLCAMTVDSDKRRVITQNLQGANPVELWHAGVRALQNRDTILAASVLRVLSALPVDEQPFGMAEFAGRFSFEPHEKAIHAINSAERDIQAALMAWRVVTHASHNPVGRLQLAMGAPAFAEAENDALVLPDISD